MEGPSGLPRPARHGPDLPQVRRRASRSRAPRLAQRTRSLIGCAGERPRSAPPCDFCHQMVPPDSDRGDVPRRHNRTAATRCLLDSDRPVGDAAGPSRLQIQLHAPPGGRVGLLGASREQARESAGGGVHRSPHATNGHTDGVGELLGIVGSVISAYPHGTSSTCGPQVDDTLETAMRDAPTRTKACVIPITTAICASEHCRIGTHRSGRAGAGPPDFGPGAQRCPGPARVIRADRVRYGHENTQTKTAHHASR